MKKAWASQVALVVKNPDMATHSVLFPGESHGRRSLEGYSPWGHKESETTEAT